MRATLIGATGMIGGQLLQRLLEDPWFDCVRILVRRPFAPEHPKLEKKLVDFNDAESFRLALEDSDVIFSCIGTTQKKVKGDKAAYRAIDFAIPVHAAQYGKDCGCQSFLLVSSVGASARSNNFYLQLKGETEEAVIGSGIPAIHIFRPSLLLGNREEFRFSEKIAAYALPVFSFLIPKKYRPIKSADVATAMLGASKREGTGVFYYEFKEIKELGVG